MAALSNMFDINKIKEIAQLDKIVFKKHALARMLERSILSDDVKEVLLDFIPIEDYYDDKPFPSLLILGYTKDRPLHAVVSFDIESEVIFVITIYEPSVELWDNNFKTRRKKI